MKNKNQIILSYLLILNKKKVGNGSLLVYIYTN